MSAIIYKNYRATPIRAKGGKGVWIWDSDGKHYLDTCGGVAVSSLGHCHPRISAAIAREASGLAWAHAGTFTTDAAEELAEFLIKRSGGMAKVQFLSGGSEAVELALKIAQQYHWERGEPERKVFIGRRQSYHGSTFGALSVSGNPGRRSIFGAQLSHAVFVSPCYAYRGRTPGETDEAYAVRLATELEQEILGIGARRSRLLLLNLWFGRVTVRFPRWSVISVWSRKSAIGMAFY
jgi:adenosylmethionine-8-amino-7-oxononanoate aminotransferase